MYTFGTSRPLKIKCAHLTAGKTCWKPELWRFMYFLQFKTKHRRKYTLLS